MVGRVEVADLRVEVERLSHAPRRVMGVVGVTGAGGVIGLEVNGPVYVRDGGGNSVRAVVALLAAALPVVGGVESVLLAKGAENAEPMSESVSERTCMRMEGAM